MTRWHGSTGQRRRTYRVSGCIASAFARPVVCSLLRCQYARGLCRCCVPSPAAQCNARPMPVRKQSASRIKSTNSHRILVILHSLPSPHNRWTLVPKRTGKKTAGPPLFPRPPSLSYRRHARYLPRKLKDKSGSTKQLPGQLASSQARRHTGGIHWPMAHASASTSSLA